MRDKQISKQGQYLYVIKFDNNKTKIGITSDVERRFIELRKHLPFSVFLVVALNNAYEVEQVLHSMFLHKHSPSTFTTETF